MMQHPRSPKYKPVLHQIPSGKWYWRERANARWQGPFEIEALAHKDIYFKLNVQLA